MRDYYTICAWPCNSDKGIMDVRLSGSFLSDYLTEVGLARIILWKNIQTAVPALHALSLFTKEKKIVFSSFIFNTCL